MLERDIPDIIDRWAISKLKKVRIGRKEDIDEFLMFNKALEKIKEEYPHIPWELICLMMLHIHDFIWQFEAGTKSAKEELKDKNYILSDKNKEVLWKAGLINFEIKNYNSLRYDLKNIICKLTNSGFIEVKKDHCSEK